MVEYPLVPMQLGMLLNFLNDPDSAVDVRQMIWTLREAVDISRMKASWRRVVARHPALRTAFDWEGRDTPIQRIRRGVTVPFTVEDLRNRAPDRRDRRVEAFLEADRRKGIDLRVAPLHRIRLFRLDDERFQLVWTFSHAILDGRSMTAVVREVLSAYDGSGPGRGKDDPGVEAPSEAEPPPFRDFVEWIHGSEWSDAKEFWRGQLAGFTTPTPLVIDRPRSSRDPDTPLRDAETELSDSVTDRLRGAAASAGVTVNCLVQTAWAVLLSRYSGERDVVFGAVRAGRRAPVPGAGRMVGLLINTVPVRVEIDDGVPVSTLLRQVRDRWVAMRPYEHAPLSEVVRCSDVSAPRLFDSLVVFEREERTRLLRKQGGAWEGRRFDSLGGSGYGLVLYGFGGPRLLLRIRYEAFRFDAPAVERLVGHLRVLLEAIATEPERSVGELPLLTGSEIRRLEVTGRGPERSYADDRLVHHLFEEHAARTPDAPAVAYEGRVLSYRELEVRANRLAHHLRTLGVGPDLVVGLAFDRSPEMVVGLLGILKAGGGYLPLDPGLPRSRLLGILEDSQASALVTDPAKARDLSTLKVPVVSADPASWFREEEATPPASEVRADHLVYVIYTSGSTGTPKGVAVEHGNLLNYVHGVREHLGLVPGWSHATVSTLAADLGNTSVFSALTGGGCLHVVSRERMLNGEALADYLEAHGIDCLKITPSHLGALQKIPDPRRLLPRRRLILGGEVCSLSWVDQLAALRPDCMIFNHYGPTETTVGVTTHRWSPRRPETASRSLAIGRPLPNSRVYVADERMRAVPVGVPGELLVGGRGVARGYLNHPEATGQRFIADAPSTASPAGRVYRTGDRVRMLEDGSLEFLGRLDRQMKVRGFRVEPGEIEAVLERHPDVEACTVQAIGDAGESRLVAYLVGTGSESDAVRDFVAERLPDHMVPTAFVFLSALPLTPNGKLDMAALPLPEVTRSAAAPDFVAPRSELEKRLAKVWQDLLGLEVVGIDDDFFELGGHSLLAVQLFARIGREIPSGGGMGRAEGPRPSLLWEAPTVRDLAARLLEHGRERSEQDDQLIEVQAGAGLPPLVVLSGDRHRLGFYVREMARSLDARQPVHVLVPHDVTAEGSPDTIEGMAQDFVVKLRAAVPRGPYALAGYSASGLVAFEMAKQLEAMGESVSQLVMIDTVLPDPRRRGLEEMTRALARLLRWSRRQETDAFLRLQAGIVRLRSLPARGLVPAAAGLGRLVRGGLLREGEAPEPESPAPEAEDPILVRARRIIDRYVPRGRFSGCVTVLVAEQGPLASRTDFETRWRKVANEVRVINVPGDHTTLVKGNARAIGSRLRALLDPAPVDTHRGADKASAGAAPPSTGQRAAAGLPPSRAPRGSDSPTRPSGHPLSHDPRSDRPRASSSGPTPT